MFREIIVIAAHGEGGVPSALHAGGRLSFDANRAVLGDRSQYTPSLTVEMVVVMVSGVNVGRLRRRRWKMVGVYYLTILLGVFGASTSCKHEQETIGADGRRLKSMEGVAAHK